MQHFSRKTLILLLTVAVVLVVIGAVLTKTSTNAPASTINSFETCVSAGNPIMESYPPRCNTNGMTYTQDVGSNIPQ